MTGAEQTFDVLHVIWHGDVLPEHVLQLGEILASMPGRDRGVFVVSHCSDMGIPLASTRRAHANDPNVRWMGDIVIIGASVRIRIVVSMFNKAMAILRLSQVPLTFVDTEAEAMAFVARRRAAKAAR